MQTTLLELMAHCFRSAPCQLLAAAHGMHASLAPLTELVAFGGPAVQEAALSAAAAALAAGLPGHEGVPAASLLPALLGILAERTSLLPGGSDDSDAACSNGCKRAPLSESTVAVAADGSVGASVSRSAALSDMAHAKQPGSGDLEAWQRHLLHLLRRCVEAAAQQGSLTDVAASLVVGLSRAAVGAREGSIFQAQLAHSLADVIFIFPHLLDMYVPWHSILPKVSLVHLYVCCIWRVACRTRAKVYDIRMFSPHRHPHVCWRHATQSFACAGFCCDQSSREGSLLLASASKTTSCSWSAAGKVMSRP